MSRLAAEMAEIRKLASSPPSAQLAPTAVAMDTSEALHRSSRTKRQAVENTQEEEAVYLLSELKVSFVNMQAALAQIQESLAHPTMGLRTLSERISQLEEIDVRTDPGPTPLQVSAQHDVLAPPTEGAILRAAIGSLHERPLLGRCQPLTHYMPPPAKTQCCLTATPRCRPILVPALRLRPVVFSSQ
ncbi:hypothetical protein HPB51_019416 [Rhipicephalus microplus]|uniref:Uncharacterized protein n=1 Tax=Rhipicephalus microplus TaxID=6941 RepID=A0A9J6EPR3_RHIMP|nr:hypothetical protein HPB51_019416 [Rhipicephalus microplus]